MGWRMELSGAFTAIFGRFVYPLKARGVINAEGKENTVQPSSDSGGALVTRLYSVPTLRRLDVKRLWSVRNLRWLEVPSCSQAPQPDIFVD